MSYSSALSGICTARRFITGHLGGWSLFGYLLFTHAAVRAENPPVTLHGTSVLRFASQEIGISIMGQADDFVQSMTAIDRQLRLGTRSTPDETTYLTFVRQQVIGWSEQERRQIEAALRSLREHLTSLPPTLWPSEVLLVQTTGQEESGAAYCRGKNVIVIPRSMAAQPQEDMARLLCHELFHILSRQSPERQQQLYSILGFQRTEPIPLPNDLAPRKLTNPDAPQINCVVTLQLNGQEHAFTPVLFSKASGYASPAAGSLFQELTFRLMKVKQENQRYVPDAPTSSAPDDYLFAPEQVSDYARRIGRNTGYIIHPEEVLADNFVHLVYQTKDLRDPWIVQRLDEVLRTFTQP